MTRPAQRCIDCTAEGVTTYRDVKPPGPRCATHRRARQQVIKDSRWASHIWKTYGLLVSEYWAIFEHQGGVCYICGRANGRTKRLSVDHDHKTGEIRGLLDTVCNKYVLGHLRDDPKALVRAAHYLIHPPAREVLGCRYVPSLSAADL